jgi:hypothetical protein
MKRSGAALKGVKRSAVISADRCRWSNTLFLPNTKVATFAFFDHNRKFTTFHSEETTIFLNDAIFFDIFNVTLECIC